MSDEELFPKEPEDEELSEEERVREETIQRLLPVYGGNRARAEQAYETRVREIEARHVLSQMSPAIRAAKGIPQPATSPSSSTSKRNSATWKMQHGG